MTDNEKKRLYVSNKGWDIISKIDERKFFALDKSNSSRSELYIFAMALGLNAYPEELGPSHDLILIQTVEPRTKALMTAYSLYSEHTKDTEKLNEAAKLSSIISLGDRYADQGLRVIEGAMKEYKSEEEYLWELFKQVDDDYKKLGI